MMRLMDDAEENVSRNQIIGVYGVLELDTASLAKPMRRHAA
jgi:hypothetical protein